MWLNCLTASTHVLASLPNEAPFKSPRRGFKKGFVEFLARPAGAETSKEPLVSLHEEFHAYAKNPWAMFSTQKPNAPPNSIRVPLSTSACIRMRLDTTKILRKRNYSV